MIAETNYSIPLDWIEEAVKVHYGYNNKNHRYSINEPTGRFFYDPWKIKEEFKNTIWERILDTLPSPVGEARVISLSPAHCYQSHSDIDNRYHLNIQSERCYLIDIENEKMHFVICDGKWYSMDASPIHTATNFGRIDRLQLVVRHLLLNNKLVKPVKATVKIDKLSIDDSRFIFDQYASKWLNQANIQGTISNFEVKNGVVSFLIEEDSLEEFANIVTDFRLELE